MPARSVVIVVSDVLDPATVVDDAAAAESELLGGLAQLRARGHDVVLLQTLHRDELEFPWTGARLLKFVDPRGLRVDIEGAAGSLRARYLERMQAHLGALDSACESQGVMLVRIATDVPLAAAYTDLLGRLSGEPTAHLVAP
jgi:hypothetical protein